MFVHSEAVGVFQALLTPLVAIIALGIAFAQWWTARNRLKLDLFDRRWAIYEITRKTLAEIFERQELSSETQRQFRAAIRTANWLLDDELDRYLRESLWPHAALYSTPLDSNEVGERHRVAKQTRDWVAAELPVVERHFGRFLKTDERLSDWLRARLPRLRAVAD